LDLKGTDFPYINSLKSHVGHCLSAAGSIECISTIVQLSQGFIFRNINCEDLNEEIAVTIDPSKIPVETINAELRVVAKASFGFGDVNACVILKNFIESR
jgi:3-oxoacyl-(acyl-carrier-protein) synthase